MPKATIEIDVPLVVRRLDALYEAAVELMIPHATTDVLGDLTRLRRYVDAGAGPANGHPFHWQFLEALIDEATLRAQEANIDI
jgi:hypothetical protein